MATTITLTGRLADITSQPLDDVTQVTVKAPSYRPGLGVELTTSQPQKVDLGADGAMTINVVEGVGWIYVEGPGWSDNIRFVAAAGMSTLWEAIVNAMPINLEAKRLLNDVGNASSSIRAELVRLIDDAANQADNAQKALEDYADQLKKQLDEAYAASQAGQTLPTYLTQAALDEAYGKKEDVERVAAVKAQPKGRKLGATGDSITAAGTGRQQEFVGITYYHLVALQRNWSVAVNAGVAGQRTDEIRARFDSDFKDKGCDIIFIRGGINDISQGKSIDDALNNLVWMAQRAIELGAVPVIGDISPVNGIGGDGVGNILGLNKRLGRWCADNGVRFAPSHEKLVSWESPNWAVASDTWDGTHPTPDGMVKIAAAFLEACEDITDLGPVSATFDGDSTNIAWTPNPLNRGGGPWGTFAKNGSPTTATATININPGWAGYATRLTLAAKAVDDSASVTAEFKIGDLGTGEKYRLASRFNLRSGSQTDAKRVRGWMILDEYNATGWVRTLSRHVEGLNLDDQGFILDFTPSKGITKVIVKFMVSAMDAAATGYFEFGQVRLAVINAERDEITTVANTTRKTLPPARFIPAKLIQGTANYATAGDMIYAPITDADTSWFIASDIAPDCSTVDIELVTVGLGGTGNARIDFFGKTATFGQPSKSTVSAALTIPDTASGTVQKTSVQAGVAASDAFTFSMNRLGADAKDTLTTAVGLVGIVVTPKS